MTVVPGYHIDSTLYESRWTVVYRARRQEDQHRVALKLLRRDYPDAEETARIRQEYELASRVHSSGVPRPVELVRVGNGYALAMEAPDALSLDQQNLFGKLALPTFLGLAQRLASHLADIHAARIVHMDISPSNVLWDRRSGAAWIVDFDISRRLASDSNAIPNSGQILGTLAYMSPEQTGRMNRSIDTRADIYGLGALLYHLLTGRLPFDCEDPLALVHAHIAQEPAPAHVLLPSVPRSVSAVLAKMLAKRVEERYQTARGVAVDLRRCLEAVEAGRPDAELELATEDLSSRFRLREQPYGREGELQTLVRLLDRVSAESRCELVLVAGEAGSGKSTLVSELNAATVARNGHFLTGKSSDGETTPYAAFIQAFSELVQHLLTAGVARMREWRERLLDAVGANGKIFIDLVPDLELIIGKQPEPPALPPAEARNRFNYTFLRLVRALCLPGHPQVIFLDDLQWADAGTLQLLELILTDPDISHLLLVGAYRDSDVGQWHSLSALLERLQRTRGPETHIRLTSLDVPTVARFVADSFHLEANTALALAEICRAKTNGNPYFLSQFLKSIHESEALHFEGQTGAWTCDLARIETMAITDNVVDLIVARIHRLTPGTQEVLKVAACIGSRFHASLVARTRDLDESLVLRSLEEGLLAGLLMASSGPNPQEGRADDSCRAGVRTYHFTHDRVRHAAQSLFTEAEQEQCHLAIWRALSAERTDSQTFDVFEVVAHLNRGLRLVGDPDERLEAARLNLRAAQQSRRALATSAALDYVGRGLALLPDDGWGQHYDLTLALHVAGLESAQLAQDWETLERYGQALFRHARLDTDRVRLHEARLALYASERRLVEALDEAVAGLALLGEKIPRKPGIPSILAGLMQTRRVVRGMAPDDFLSLPDMEDPRTLAVMRLILQAGEPSYWSEPNLVPILTFKMVQLTARYGVCWTCPWGIIGFALVLAGPFKRIDEGIAWTRVGLQLSERVDADEIRPHVAFVYRMFFGHLVGDLRDALGAAEEAYDSAMNVGSPGAAASCRHLWGVAKLWGTNDLGAILEGLEGNTTLMGKLHHDWYYRTSLDLRLAASMMAGQPPPVDVATGATFDADACLADSERLNDKSALAMHHTAMLAVHCLLGDHAAAQEHGTKAARVLDGVAASYYEALHHFHFSVAVLCNAWAQGRSPGRLLRQVRRKRKVLGSWARYGPQNFECWCRIIDALIARARGDLPTAVRLLEEAVALASTHDQLRYEAMAYELLADTLAAAGSRRTAAAYRFEACYAYQRFGAAAKVERLLASHPELADRLAETHPTEPSTGKSSGKGTRTTTGSRTGRELDIESVLKATRAISGEIVLDSLIRNLMTIILENAGAQRGILVLSHEGNWNVEAVADIQAPEPVVVRSLPLDSANNDTLVVPVDIVHFVINTGRDVVLDDAAVRGEFVLDPYVKALSPKSVMCARIAYRGELTGIIYLENSSTTHAFTTDRVRIVQVLCSQVAVSMENARLFRGKEQLISAYQRFVPQEFLSHLGKRSIIDVALGDQVQKEMTVLFSDIRGFTALSETMDPQRSFSYINSYLSAMEPVIRTHNGFIDKYIGDAIMALFPTNADDAVQGSIEMVRKLRDYNEDRAREGLPQVNIGIGLNTGQLMLGTVGGLQRMDGTVISDAVNLASRIEALTKVFAATILAGEGTLRRLADPSAYRYREVGRIRVKGKATPVTVYEFFDADPPAVAALKQDSLEDFARGLRWLGEGRLEEAGSLFSAIVAANPEDRPARACLQQCRKPRDAEEASRAAPVDPDGVE